MLFTKSILKAQEVSDGVRISVMSRHTLIDGVTPDVRITPKCYDEWESELAPPERLVGDYYKRNLTWEKFKEEYLVFLQQNMGKVKELARRAIFNDITILCIEDSPKYCHRRLLAEECQKYEQSLIVRHR
jgi:uncharacterized protein YeaO (DUF488 family)